MASGDDLAELFLQLFWRNREAFAYFHRCGSMRQTDNDEIPHHAFPPAARTT
jgi:hypothetical protein